MPKVSESYRRSRREQIVEAARAAFARRGFQATSMNDLVAATGLSMGALYRYFPRKSDLVLAVVEGRDGRIEGSFDADEEAGDLIARLAAYVSGDAAGKAHAALITHLWSEAALDDDLAAVVCRQHSQLRDHVASRLPRSPADADGTVTARADTLLAALIGCAALAAAGHPVDDGAVKDALLDVARGSRSAPASGDARTEASG